jgi:uncharacterized protein (DUF1800 family)
MFLNRLFLFIAAVVCNFSIQAQLTVYDDYVGGGHSEDILISSSSNFTDPEWDDNSSPKHTIDGEGMNGPEAEAARFLYQAALGGTSGQIEALSKTLDFEAWIDEQVSQPQTDFLKLTRNTFLSAEAMYQQFDNNLDIIEYNEIHFQYAWWHAALTKPDVLRQRVAYALSEIFVISTNSDIRNDGEAVASYYNMLMKNAFGNYRELIEDVARHPAMGIYLSHFRNQKADTTLHIHPDENFARELLQLFSIGLYKLNLNGTHKTDGSGNSIPAYNQDDIRSLARVFTGLGAGGITQEGIDAGRDIDFSIHANYLDYTKPMVMYDESHDDQQKVLFGNSIIPANQTGNEDIDMALDYIFNHPNVGPFIARRLIQQLVKSNPSASYIRDVALAFNDNGEGERGDMEAVIREILLHEEARECLWMEEFTNGKLKSPVGRYLQFARLFAQRENQQYFWNSGFTFEYFTNQLPMASPSVFNFYLPDHQPAGPISELDLYAPEFEIHNSATSLGFANEASAWVKKQEIFNISLLEYVLPAHFEKLETLARNPNVLLDNLDLLLCHGRLSQETREIIIETITDVEFGTDYLKTRNELALFLILISPDFAIQK